MVSLPVINAKILDFNYWTVTSHSTLHATRSSLTTSALLLRSGSRRRVPDYPAPASARATELPEGDIQFINIVDAKIQGFELVTKYSFIPNELTFSSGYTYLWARDLNLNKAMKYRPRHIWYFNAEFNPFPFEFRIDFRYMSKVEEIDFMLTEPPINLVPEGDQRVAIYVVDLSAGYNFELFNFPVKIFVNAKNLLNYNYVEFIGNLAPLRNVSLSIEGYF